MTPALVRRSIAVGAALCAAALAGPASAPAAPPRVPILTYHHVGEAAPAGARNPPLWVRGRDFRAQVDAFARRGFTAVTLGRVWRAWHGGPALPARPIVLSFDDGYSGQESVAARLLRARRWPGVLYLQTNRVGARGGLTRAQVRRMIGWGWEVDAHTVTHPDLTAATPARVASELQGSRAAIQRAFGVPASFLAYPYGRTDPAVERAARAAGFLAATTTRAGLASAPGNPYALPRITVNGRRPALAIVDTVLARLGRR